MSKSTMQAVVFDEPADVQDDYGSLVVRDVPLPRKEIGEVIVRTAMTPINPSDLLFVTNRFPGPRAPEFPGQVAGIGGVGYANARDIGQTGDSDRLVSYTSFNAWAEFVAVQADSLIELPADYPLHLAAQFSNVITAWELVERSGVSTGQWLAITAGHSAVASMATQFAKQRGIKIVSVVRREREDFNLRDIGADEVLVASSSGDLTDEILGATCGEKLLGVLDCVAGPRLGELIRSCLPFSRVQLYGCLDEGGLGVSGGDLMYSFVEITPYSYRFTFTSPETEADRQLVAQVISESANGQVRVETAGVFPLKDFKAALREHLHGTRPGKVMLAPGVRKKAESI